MGRTTISVTDELADELYEQKGRGESYEDVIWRLLEEAGGEGRPEGGDAHAPVEEPDAPRETPTEEKGFDAIVDEVAEEVLPGSGEKLEARREALHAVVEYLREEGTATPSDFQEDVYPDHTAYYTTGEDPARSWWKNCIYKGLSELASRTDAIVSPDTSGGWTWRGE